MNEILTGWPMLVAFIAGVVACLLVLAWTVRAMERDADLVDEPRSASFAHPPCFGDLPDDPTLRVNRGCYRCIESWRCRPRTE